MGQCYLAKAAFSGTSSDLWTNYVWGPLLADVGAIPYSMAGMAIDPTSGILYGITNDNSASNPHRLVTINTSTGAATVIANLGVVLAFDDIDFDSTGQLYALTGFTGFGSKALLKKIDKATGAITAVGSTGLDAGGMGFAIRRSTNVGYVCGNDAFAIPTLSSINLTTAGATTIGHINPHLPSGAQGLSFDSDELLWFINAASRIFSIDIAALTSSEIGILTQSDFDAIAWDGDQPMPGPAAAASWNYNSGANTLTVVVHNSINGRAYQAYADSGSTENGTGNGGDLTFVVTGVTGTAGTLFSGEVDDEFLGIAVDENMFTYGTSSTTGTTSVITWHYDGTSTVTADFAAPIPGSNYQMAVTYLVNGTDNRQDFQTLVGSSTSHFSITTTNPPTPGTLVEATVRLNVSPFTPFAKHFFTASGSGRAGNPATPFVPPVNSALVGIRTAFGYNAFDDGAAFVRLDDPTVPALAGTINGTHSVTAFTIDRGRTYELDKTQTGTASITMFDSTGLFDPTNPSGPFYGNILPMQRTIIGVQHPFTKRYHDLFTGFLESWDWTEDQAEKLMTIQIGLVDGFEPLTRAEIPPGVTGVTVFAGTSDVQTRIDALLDVAFWPTATGWRNVNTGNVFLQQTIYNPQTSVLSAIQDAADAEFPGVANFFMSKTGAATFFGRYPRFQPTNYPQDVNFYTAGDKKAANTFGGATITEIEWTLDSKNVINACLAYPFGIIQGDIPGQLVSDTTSIATYGVRTLSLPDLIEDGQPAGGGVSPQPVASANAVGVFYGQYYVDNYKDARIRISKLIFKSVGADSATMTLILGIEIGDIITVYSSNPGGGGFGKETGGDVVSSPAQFFVEGIHYDVHGFHQDVADITLSLDVSPRAWFSFAPWAGSEPPAPGQFSVQTTTVSGQTATRPPRTQVTNRP